VLAQASISIDDIPGGRAAVNTIVGKIAEFNRVPSRLSAVQGILNTTAQAAAAKSDSAAHIQATVLLQQVQQLQTDYASTASVVADVMDQLRTFGLAQGITLDFVLTAGQAASGVLSILSQTSDLESQARALASGQGVQTSALARAGAILGTSPVVKYLVIGGLGYVVLKGLRRGRVSGV
jgi:hypothetical protein